MQSTSTFDCGLNCPHHAWVNKKNDLPIGHTKRYVALCDIYYQLELLHLTFGSPIYGFIRMWLANKVLHEKHDIIYMVFIIMIEWPSNYTLGRKQNI